MPTHGPETIEASWVGGWGIPGPPTRLGCGKLRPGAQLGQTWPIPPIDGPVVLVWSKEDFHGQMHCIQQQTIEEHQVLQKQLEGRGNKYQSTVVKTFSSDCFNQQV